MLRQHGAPVTANCLPVGRRSTGPDDRDRAQGGKSKVRGAKSPDDQWAGGTEVIELSLPLAVGPIDDAGTHGMGRCDSRIDVDPSEPNLHR